MTIELLALAKGLRLALAFYEPYPQREATRGQEREAVDVLLSQLLGLDEPPLREHRADGSPYLPAFPELSLSISHTWGSVAVLLSSADRILGVDVERYREQLVSVSSRYISPEEWAYLRAHTAYTDEELRLLLWTAKEASFKIAHPASGSLLSYQVEAIDTDAQLLHLASQEQGRTLWLHYLFRPPYLISLGSLSQG